MKCLVANDEHQFIRRERSTATTASERIRALSPNSMQRPNPFAAFNPQTQSNLGEELLQAPMLPEEMAEVKEKPWVLPECDRL